MNHRQRAASIRLMITALVAFLLPGASAPSTQSFDVENQKRTAIVYSPADKSKAAPVVFVFHGHGGTSGSSVRKFKIHSEWPEAIVIYPQGLPSRGITDPEGKKPGWQKRAGELGDRDLKFFDKMLDWVKKNYNVDGKRVYACGHSNGGSFTYVLWGNRGDLLAAVAPSASVFGVNLRGAKPLHALIIAGTEDELVRFEQQERTIGWVKSLNQVSDEPKALGNGIVAYRGTRELWTYIYKGSHTMPDIAGSLMVRFFKSHSKS